MARLKTNKSVSQIKAEIERLNAELEAAKTIQAQNIGALAIDAGLADVPLSDLKNAFGELATRFRADANQ
ncbi:MULTISPECIES: TraC family protein [Brucella/Ochrobactrum group]|uniref:TraC family protein n=1 Tax=Brucella/Ochrobactrum group TaxID=2826938 RepID=UPI001C0577F1|nr:TraC family protein [Brucella sp. NBRC 12950]QWK81278.1 conjugal transfer protein [Ochrobactrum sp. BTU1]GLU29880.1 hypothetical protein Brsp01_51130 [Brucella sp. NBRC 12950]